MDLNDYCTRIIHTLQSIASKRSLISALTNDILLRYFVHQIELEQQLLESINKASAGRWTIELNLPAFDLHRRLINLETSQQVTKNDVEQILLDLFFLGVNKTAPHSLLDIQHEAIRLSEELKDNLS